jgi:hypothetical protein
MCGIGDGDRAQQRRGVGVRRLGVEVVGRRHLAELAGYMTATRSDTFFTGEVVR